MPGVFYSYLSAKIKSTVSQNAHLNKMWLKLTKYHVVITSHDPLGMRYVIIKIVSIENYQEIDIYLEYGLN